MKNKFYLLLICLTLLLSACSKEPVIELSEENQEKVEQHIAIQKNPELAEKLEQKEKEEQESAQKAQEAKEAEEAEANEELTLPNFSQSPQVDSIDLSIKDYLPQNSYQLKIFQQSGEKVGVYTDYLDESLMRVQLAYQSESDLTHEVYDWSTGAMRLVYNKNKQTKLENNLEMIDPQNEIIVLSPPFSKGATWQSRPGETSEITAIYSSLELLAGTYNNVIELTTTGENFNYREYWAQGEGIVARWNNYPAGDPADFCEIVENNHEVMEMVDLKVSSPVKDEKLIEKKDGQIAWQTNMNRGQAFEELFKLEGLIGEDIIINSIYLTDQTVEVDFSSGVVASINDNSAPEEAVIASIVTTLGEFFNRDEVLITVDGLIMAPDNFLPPENGIYNLELNYLKNPRTVEETVETAGSEESSSAELVELSDDDD